MEIRLLPQSMKYTNLLNKFRCYCVNEKGDKLGFEHNKWETDDKVLCRKLYKGYNLTSLHSFVSVKLDAIFSITMINIR